MRKLILTLLLFTTAVLAIAQPSNEAKKAYNKALYHFNTANYTTAIPYLQEAVMESPDFKDAYHLMAECSERANMPDKAILNYEQVARLSPRDEKVRYNMALLLIKQGKQESAMQALEEALDINPNYTKAHTKLGAIKLALGQNSDADVHLKTAESQGASDDTDYKLAKSLYDQGAYEKALPYAEKAVQQTSANAYYLLALIQEKLNQLKDAKSSYEEVLDIEGRHLDALLNMGIIYYNEEKFDKAAGYFDRATAIEPEDASIQNFLGRSYLSQGDGESALVHLKRSAELKYNDGELHFHLAKAYKKTGDEKMANEHYIISKSMGYKHAVQAIASETTGAYNDGITAFQNGFYDDAIKAFKKAIKKQPDNAKYYYNLGLAYQENGETGNAESAFKKTVELDSRHGRAHLALATIYVKTGLNAKAIKSYEKAIKSGENSGDSYYGLGNIHYENGDYDAASNYYNKAINKEPDNADYYYNSGMNYIKLKQYNKAITQLKNAVKNDMGHHQSWYTLGLAYRDIKEYEEALDVGQKLIKINPDYAYGYYLLADVYEELDDSYNSDKYLKMAKKINPNIDKE